MFQLAGKVAKVDQLREGYSLLRLYREEAGILGPEVTVLIPPLISVRDQVPDKGDWVEIGAQSIAETGQARVWPNCFLVARYIWPSKPGTQPTRDDSISTPEQANGNQAG